MSMVLMTVLKTLVVLVLLWGLIYSLRLVSDQKKEKDMGVSSRVKANPIAMNPVLWSYIFTTAIVVAMVWVFKLYYKFPF